MGRILALDVGHRRIGVALSDPLGITAQPLEVIDRRRVNAHARVQELVINHEVTKVVAGMPLHLSGTQGEAVALVNAFLDKLQPLISVPIETWDERFTSVAAERVLLEAGVRRGKRREKRDKIAAALILQSYLDAGGRSS